MKIPVFFLCFLLFICTESFVSGSSREKREAADRQDLLDPNSQDLQPRTDCTEVGLHCRSSNGTKFLAFFNPLTVTYIEKDFSITDIMNLVIDYKFFSNRESVEIELNVPNPDGLYLSTQDFMFCNLSNVVKEDLLVERINGKFHWIDAGSDAAVNFLRSQSGTDIFNQKISASRQTVTRRTVGFQNCHRP